MAVLGLLFLLALLGALLVYIVWATLRWLVTGRKPQVVLVWQQFRNMRQNFAQGGFRAGTATGAQSHGVRLPTQPQTTRWWTSRFGRWWRIPPDCRKNAGPE